MVSIKRLPHTQPSVYLAAHNKIFLIWESPGFLQQNDGADLEFTVDEKGHNFCLVILSSQRTKDFELFTSKPYS